MTPSLLSQVVLNAVMLGAMYATVSLGFTLVFGIMHIVNFAHGAIYMLGGYAIYYLAVKLGLNYFVALVLTMLVMALFGAFLEKTLFSHFRGRAGILPVAMLAFGLSMVLEGGALTVFGVTDKAVGSIVSGVIRLGGVTLSKERLLVLGACTLLIILLYLFIHYVRAGQAMLAIEQDPDAAAILGININNINSLAFAISCSLAGTSAAVVVPMFWVNSTIGEGMIVKVFAVVILGGLGSIPGALLGGLSMGFIDSLGQTFLGRPAEMISFVVILIILVFRPRGFLGHA